MNCLLVLAYTQIKMTWKVFFCSFLKDSTPTLSNKFFHAALYDVYLPALDSVTCKKQVTCGIIKKLRTSSISATDTNLYVRINTL